MSTFTATLPLSVNSEIAKSLFDKAMAVPEIDFNHDSEIRIRNLAIKAMLLCSSESLSSLCARANKLPLLMFFNINSAVGGLDTNLAKAQFLAEMLGLLEKEDLKRFFEKSLKANL